MAKKICLECGRHYISCHKPSKYCSRWCASHSKRLAQIRADMAVEREKNFVENFWARVIKTKDCWLWNQGTSPAGYGRLRFKAKANLAHRVAWEITFGPIPDGLFICHKCDNPICVNPEHLFLGTNTDNMQDASKKGRTSWGEKSGHAKLNTQQVLKIRKLYKSGNVSYQSLANKFNVGMVTIANIITRTTWAHLEE